MPILKTKTLTNTNGCSLEVSNYGATIISLKVPNKHGESVNVVAGLSTPEAYTQIPYTKHGLYLGCTIGRYAGRISNSKESNLLKGTNLTFKDGVHLHGGKHGFDKKYWTFETQKKTQTITLSYISKHLEEGYPGNLNVFVTYILTEENEVIIEYTATTDRDTYVNLTNHSYFNLNGAGSILDHHLQIASDSYLEVDSNLVPTGNNIPVLNSCYDRTQRSKIGNTSFKGYDDTFILNDQLEKASLYSTSSGILMTIATNQSAMVVYTPKIFPELDFKDATVYKAYPAICFENQHFPDAPNNDQFPSSILQPNDIYRNRSLFAFSIINE